MGYRTFHERVTAILHSGVPSAVANAEAEARLALEGDGWDQTERGLITGILGELLAMQGKYAEAGQMMRLALPMVKSGADRLQVAVGWADAINADNDHSDAAVVVDALRVALGDPAVQTSPTRVCGQAWLARLSIVASPDEAISYAREAVSLSTVMGRFRSESLLALGYALRHARQYDEAIVVVAELVSLAKGACLTEAQTLLAELYDAVGEDEETDRVLFNAVENVPLEFVRQYHRVLTAIHRVLQKRPERGTQMLGRLLLRMGIHIREAQKGGT